MNTPSRLITFVTLSTLGASACFIESNYQQQQKRVTDAITHSGKYKVSRVVGPDKPDEPDHICDIVAVTGSENNHTFKLYDPNLKDTFSVSEKTIRGTPMDRNYDLELKSR